MARRVEPPQKRGIYTYNPSESMKAFFERYRPHPWHGLAVGPNPPEILNAYIEITPFDTVKWEIDKETGYLHVDRPQTSNSLPPTLYGFVPRTYCGERSRSSVEPIAVTEIRSISACSQSGRSIVPTSSSERGRSEAS